MLYNLEQLPNKNNNISFEKMNIINVSKELMEQIFNWVISEISYSYISLTSLSLLTFRIMEENISLSSLWEQNINKLYEIIIKTIGNCSIYNDGDRIVVIGITLPYKWFFLNKN
jgi:hypothetical protein